MSSSISLMTLLFQHDFVRIKRVDTRFDTQNIDAGNFAQKFNNESSFI